MTVEQAIQELKDLYFDKSIRKKLVKIEKFASHSGDISIMATTKDGSSQGLPIAYGGFTVMFKKGWR